MAEQVHNDGTVCEKAGQGELPGQCHRVHATRQNPDWLDALEREQAAVEAEAELVRDGYHPQRDA